MNITSDKKNLMFALIFIWILVLFLRSTVFGPKQIHVPLKNKPVDKNILFKKTEQESFNISDLQLDQLYKPKIKYQENVKNIFKSIIIPQVKYTPPPPAVVKTTPPPAPPKRNPLEDELKKFQFIGFSENKGKTKVFLSKDDNLFVAGKNEKIEDKFLIKDITQTEIILTLVNQKNIEVKLSLKDEQGGPVPGYQNPPPMSYPEFEEPPVFEEPPPIQEEIPDNPQPVPPPHEPPHRPPHPDMGRPPAESEF